MIAPDARRLQRAGLTAGALILLTLAGHTAGNGPLPNLVGLSLVVSLSFGLAFATTARRLSASRLLAFLLATEALLHVILTAAHGAAHGTTTGPSAGAMVAGHTAATLVAAVVLEHADKLIDRWATLWSTTLGFSLHLTPNAEGDRCVAPVSVGPVAPDQGHLTHHVVRRGPPALAAASHA